MPGAVITAPRVSATRRFLCTISIYVLADAREL